MRGKIQLFTCTLFLLAFVYELKFIYCFANSTMYAQAADFVEMFAYVVLMTMIVYNRFSLKQLLLIVISGVILLMGYVKTGYAVWFRSFLIILAAKDVPFEKIRKTMLRVYLSVIGLGILLFVLGISDAGVGRRGYLGFGFIGANALSTMLTVAVLLWICGKEKLHIQDVFFIWCLAILDFLLLNSRTAVIALCLLPLLYAAVGKMIKKESRLGERFVVNFQALFFAVTIGLVILYPKSSFLRYSLDAALNWRLFLNFNNIHRFGVPLLGQNVQLFDETSTYLNYYTQEYHFTTFNTVDNTYIVVLITLGLLPTLCFLICNIFVSKKAWNNRHVTLLTTVMILSLYGFMESSMQEIYINFPYLYLLAAPSQKANHHRVRKKIQWKWH